MQRVVRQAEAGGAVEHLSAAASTGPGLELKREGGIAGARVAAGGGQADQGTIGGQLQQGVGIGLTQGGEVFRGKAQPAATMAP